MDGQRLETQYKDHLSTYRVWEQQEHATDWILLQKNLGTRLSLDELAIHCGELYTVLTNKSAKGKKGAIVAMVKGTKVRDVAAILMKIPEKQRLSVTEVTADMADNMMAIIRIAFPNAQIVTDRFHVQQLVSAAVQEIRISLRREAMQTENAARKEARAAGKRFYPTTHANGDTDKQLLARSRHLLFKPHGRWTSSQQERARALWKAYPILTEAYDLAMAFRGVYEHGTTIEDGKQRLHRWYATVEKKLAAQEQLEPFRTPMETVQGYEETILNYFRERSTNAAAESFNAKLKGFRTLVRGVSDVPFFLYRVVMLYG